MNSGRTAFGAARPSRFWKPGRGQNGGKLDVDLGLEKTLRTIRLKQALAPFLVSDSARKFDEN
jgi:hypothetical protein